MALMFEYNKETRTAEVCGVEDKFCEQIVIPSTVEYYGKKYDVVAIKEQAFSECLKLKSVTIPDSVTSIGVDAFLYCSSLREFKGKFAADNGRCLIKDGVLIAYASASGEVYAIPKSVTAIGRDAFSGCSSLTSITIPDSVTAIGGWVFHGCSNLKEFKGKFAADNGRCLIKDGALIAYANASGEVYAIPKSVTAIGGSAFSGCSSLKSITIPDSVTEIGGWAFDGCSSLTSITIPDSITEIGCGTFEGCSSLTSITIPDSVTVIGWSAFEGCSSLTNVTIPNGVTEIGDYAFKGCSSLTSITIPNGVTKIGEDAFSGCSSLTSVTIPDSVTGIGWFAFSGCSSLREFKGKFAANNGRCLIKNGVLIAYASASGEVYAIPNGVTKIGEYAFYGCSSLTSVTIPDSVTAIGICAFESCDKLKNVDICNEKGCVNIGYHAFGSDVKVTYLGKAAQPKKKGFFARLFGKK